VACGSSREAAWETTPEPAASQKQTDEAKSQRAKLLEQAESAWVERGTEAKARTAIDKWKQALELDPDDPETWEMLSRAHYFLADCHHRFDDSEGEKARKKAMVETFDRGIKAAERGLMQYSDEFAQRMRAGTRIEKTLGILDKGAVPLLYWRSSNMGKWGSNKGFATVLAHKDEVRAIMKRCLELQPDYFYGGVHRYFGAYFARVPAYAGGDLERSREHFEQALEQNPDYFGTHVLYAQDYAIKAQKRKVFDKHIQYVLDHDPDVIPGMGPKNRCEQRKARQLKDKADEVFE
jgi:tetratricopeptide (TPR) repeat protein